MTCTSVTVTSTTTNDYKCVNGVCTQGGGTLPAGCNNTCVISPSTQCIPKDDEYYIPGIGCFKKTYVYAAAGLIGFMMITK